MEHGARQRIRSCRRDISGGLRRRDTEFVGHRRQLERIAVGVLQRRQSRVQDRVDDMVIELANLQVMFEQVVECQKPTRPELLPELDDGQVPRGGNNPARRRS